MPNHSKAMVRFTLGKANDLGGAQPKALPWDTFLTLFREPVRTNERQREYDALSEDGQKELKSVAGWWFRSQTDGHRRNAKSARPSDLLTFDFDYSSPEFFRRAREGQLGLPWPYFIHTSRRHRAEKPRFRLVVLLGKPVPNELYGPVSRIAAKVMDPNMEFVDKVSFRAAQMMFRPTASADQEYIFQAHEGEPLDWEVLLDDYETVEGDWKDLSQLPRAAGEKELRQTAEKAEDPTTKDGPVGWFCRAYSIHDAITEFDLPYSPTEGDRYTYTLGTTYDGVVTYDDLFLYSHHGSDPCGESLVNAFDLVRIHKFGDLVDNEGQGTPMAHRASWKQMISMAETMGPYRDQRTASRFDIDKMFDSIAEEDQAEIEEASHPEIDPDVLEVIGYFNGYKPPEPVIAEGARPIKFELARRRPKPDKDWINTLDMTPQGILKKTAYNVAKIIGHDPRIRDAVGFNEFTNDAVALRSINLKEDWIPSFPVHDKLNGEPWQDRHDAVLRTLLSAPNGPGQIGWGIDPPDRDIGAGLRLASHANSFHPVRETLLSVKHDGVARAELLFIRWLGCPDTPYHRETARLFLIAAVGRIFEPGLKFDNAPVLWGAQGIRKSTFIRYLALNWFGELTADFNKEQQLAEQMAGCWIMELAELASMARGQVEDVKVFMSALKTKVRLAYDRRVSEFPRQCVFMGSTNNIDFLKDDTGNRRFWPIEVLEEQIDVDAFALEVPQILAEAVVLYRAMREEHPHGDLPLMLSAEAGATARELQERSRRKGDVDLLVDVFQSYLNAKVSLDSEGFDRTLIRREQVTVLEMLKVANDSPVKIQSTQAAAMIGLALTKCGWENTGRTRADGLQTSRYRPGSQVLSRWALDDDANADFI